MRTSTEADAEQLHRALGEASTRLEVLRRMHESGAGLHGGVREVLAAGRDGRLEGILGTVAELLVVPESLEVAIEVALGSRLQDIVVAAWSNAEAAIAHLKQSGAGRATFQPLDTVRADRAKTHAAGAIGLPGVLGVAAQLVSAPAHLAPVVAALLGRTLVTDELDTARAALGHLPAGWSVVTITGEIARAGGSVTGGSAAAESGTLARERELRELPDAIAVLERDLAAARDRAEKADAAVSAVRNAKRHAEDERAALGAAAQERRQQRQRLTDWLTRAAW